MSKETLDAGWQRAQTAVRDGAALLTTLLRPLLCDVPGESGAKHTDFGFEADINRRLLGSAPMRKVELEMLPQVKILL